MPLSYQGFADHLRQRGCLVDRRIRGQSNLGGDYVPPRTIKGKPILRTYYGEGEKLHPTVEELCNLAHEYGHHQRWEKKERLPSYDEWITTHSDPTKWPQEPLVSRQAVLEEEEAAWRYAAEELRALGFDDWPAFNASRTKGLRIYHVLLALSA